MFPCSFLEVVCPSACHLSGRLKACVSAPRGKDSSLRSHEGGYMRGASLWDFALNTGMNKYSAPASATFKWNGARLLYMTLQRNGRLINLKTHFLMVLFCFLSIVHQPKNNTIFYLLIHRESVLKSNHVPKNWIPHQYWRGSCLKQRSHDLDFTKKISYGIKSPNFILILFKCFCFVHLQHCI